MKISDFILDDSRRLTGPNLLWEKPGAIIDVLAPKESREVLINTWQTQVKKLFDALGWSSEEFCARLHHKGASLAISAPIDLLYSACEINEAAWNSSVALINNEEAQDFETVVNALEKEILQEQNPRLIELQKIAARKGVTFLVDDDFVTLGMGHFSQTWPVREIPNLKEIVWNNFKKIPLAIITGTNGKSTTVRLLASILESAAKTPGITSTDYIMVGKEIISRGDYSGPGGARTVLRHKSAQAAILEVARGGILRRGLPVQHADVALVNNVAKDHLGDYGIDTLDDLIEAKFVVAKAIDQNGIVVLNADDVGIVKFAHGLDNHICWFSIDENNPILLTQMENNGEACFVKNGQIVYARNYETQTIINVEDIPITMKGAAEHNTANSLAACATAINLGIDIESIQNGLKSFSGDNEDNPGRGNYFNINGAQALVDFAHNVHGLEAIIKTLKQQPSKRRLIMMGHAGDRSEEDIFELIETAVSFKPDKVIACEFEKYLRGKALGEIPLLIKRGFEKYGIGSSSISLSPNVLQAIKDAVAWSKKGDQLLLLVLAERDEVFEYLKHAST